MWMERYLLITTSLSRDFLPSSWGIFQPTIFDILTYVGSIGVFIVTFLLFCRFLPMISMCEMRGLLPGSRGHEEGR
jgi:molybdopterin-containing oxidoreductase family membrane subunit